MWPSAMPHPHLAMVWLDTPPARVTFGATGIGTGVAEIIIGSKDPGGDRHIEERFGSLAIGVPMGGIMLSCGATGGNLNSLKDREHSKSGKFQGSSNLGRKISWSRAGYAGHGPEMLDASGFNIQPKGFSVPPLEDAMRCSYSDAS